MSPNKPLHLKRTPAEQAERDFRKARKALRKATKLKRRSLDVDDSYDSDSREHKRRRTDDNSDEEYGPRPVSSSNSSSGSYRARKPDFDYIQAELEEARFRDKMWSAIGDDERLDSVEASLNSYAHVPRRWRGGGMERVDDETVDPHFMEDEDYAEWVRAGMWRKKHAAEHEEQMRREAERQARAEREKAMHEETRRLERAAEEERKKLQLAREVMRSVELRELYETRWKAILASASPDEKMLCFQDVPWPVLPADASKKGQHVVTRIEDITAEAISAFLLPSSESQGKHDTQAAKDRKEKLRETMLRFHPDKFEGRIMKRVKETDRELVKEAVGIVARTVNNIMGHNK